MRIRSRRHRGCPGVAYQAFRDGNAIELRMYVSGRRYASWPIMKDQIPSDPFDVYRLLDAMMGDMWLETGNHIDAAVEAVTEVVRR